jgi:hypothetical protein
MIGAVLEHTHAAAELWTHITRGPTRPAPRRSGSPSPPSRTAYPQPVARSPSADRRTNYQNEQSNIIEITHTAAAGTLVHGTTRGDGTNTILPITQQTSFGRQFLRGKTFTDTQIVHHRAERVVPQLVPTVTCRLGREAAGARSVPPIRRWAHRSDLVSALL